MLKNLAQLIISFFDKKKTNLDVQGLRKGFSVSEIIGSPYSGIWNLIPGKPLHSSVVVVVLQGLTQISDAINTTPLICGEVASLNELEKSLLDNLNLTASSEPCSCLYLLYESSLSINPSSQVWAVSYNNGNYKVFTRRIGENHRIEFIAI